MRSFAFNLDDEQQAVVDSTERAIQVVASAGSGKTEVIARRIERLIDDSEGEHFNILALSYTVKAAEQMRERLQRRLGGQSRRLHAETIHGFAHRLLREGGTRLGLPVEPELFTRMEDRVEILTRWLEVSGLQPPDNVAAALFQIDKDMATLTPTTGADQWREALSSLNALDFPLTIEKAIELLSLKADRRRVRQRYKHVIVDEAQNLTAAQYKLLAAMVGAQDEHDAIDVAMFGDDKQSVVEFAGGSHLHFLGFADDFMARPYRLTKNYRSAEKIVTVGTSIAVALGHDESARTADAEYGAIGSVDVCAYPTEEAEARGVAAWAQELLSHGIPRAAAAPTDSAVVAAEEIAVLARTNGALRLAEKALRDQGIETATAVASDAWLATDYAKVAIEVMTFRDDVSKRSAAWELRRFLAPIDPRDDLSLADLEELLTDSDDAVYRRFVALLDCSDGDQFVRCLSQISEAAELSDDATWWDDVELIGSAWNDFEMRTPVGERSWPSFLIDLSRQWQGRGLDPGVRLLTVQKAQGGEFRAVAMVGMNDGQLPDFRAKSDAEQIAELRIFYVGVTRSSRVLLLTRAESRDTRYGPRDTLPSAFLQHAQRPSH